MEFETFDMVPKVRLSILQTLWADAITVLIEVLIFGTPYVVGTVFTCINKYYYISTIEYVNH